MRITSPERPATNRKASNPGTPAPWGRPLAAFGDPTADETVVVEEQVSGRLDEGPLVLLVSGRGV